LNTKKPPYQQHTGKAALTILRTSDNSSLFASNYKSFFTLLPNYLTVNE